MFRIAEKRLEVLRRQRVFRGRFALDDGIDGRSQPIRGGGRGAVERGEEWHDRVGPAAAEFLPRGRGLDVARPLGTDGFDAVGEVGDVGGGGEGGQCKNKTKRRQSFNHLAIPAEIS